MNTTFSFEQTKSFEREIKDSIFQIINAAIISISPMNRSEDLDFISNRDLGDEDAHDLFES